MAYPGKEILNPVTGQSIRFIQTSATTNGTLLEMESSYSTRSLEPVPHYHPQQEENFTVLKGELSVRMDGELRILKAGDKLHIPPNKTHSMWNDSDNETRVNWQVRPALESEYFLENGIGLAADGKVNSKGMPDILQVSLLANKYSHVFRLAKPPFIVQKIVFAVLTPFAWLAGKRATYKNYLD